jgi:response regulator of citrate/malate metabolism
LVILGDYPKKAGTIELYPKNQDFPQQLQALGKVTTLQNFTEQYKVFQNRLHDTTIHTTTLDISRSNLIYYIRSTTTNHATLQKGIHSMTKNTVVTLRIDEQLNNTIQSMAQKEEIPASYIIRRLIKAGLNAEGKHLPSQVKATQIPEWE